MPARLLIAALAAALVGVVAPGRPAATPARAALEEAGRQAAAMPRLHSLVVSRRGDLLLEHYGRGVSATRLANIKSASKSVIGALVGIALDRALIPSVREPVSRYFPQLARDADPRKRAITIEHLLTMQSGLESTSGPQYGPFVRSRNWVAFALGRPLVSPPGTVMEYSTGTSHVLSALLTKVTGRSTLAFAREALSGPLGFTFASWQRDPQGIYFGGNEMLMTPKQMLAFGELWLQGGRVNGRQVVSRSWVDTSCVPRTVSRWDPGREYGYGWWIDDIGGHTACFAWGFGGQYILVFRDLDLVVVATSSTAVSDERWDYRNQLLTLVADEIVQPVARSRQP